MSDLVVSNLSAQLDAFHLSVSELSVQGGEIVAVIGRSGCGKSTLLHSLAGFVQQSAGNVLVGGKNLAAVAPEKRRMALVFQRSSLFSHLSVQENVEFGLKCQGVASPLRKGKAAEWLTRLGISELASRRPHQISGGQAQRVALARAFAVGFPVLLLDEPFSALDVDLRTQLHPLLKNLVKETSVSALLVSHDKSDVITCAERVVVMENGKIIEQGRVAEVQRQPQSAYAKEFFKREEPE